MAASAPFVSLNSWDEPGSILQACDPVEVVEGTARDWQRLGNALGHYRRNAQADSSTHPRGAAVGYFTYEGDYWFGFFPEISVIKSERGSTVWQQRREAFAGAHPLTGELLAKSDWRSNFTRADYERMVLRAKEYIAAGDIYQVNLSQRFSLPLQTNPYVLFEQLLWRSPAPGGAFLDTGERQVLSSSPELFLRIRGRQIVTRPIKGTRPRSRDPLCDQQLAYELLTDPKELAELVMITDLERNDLGRVCEFGTVEVTELLKEERYAQVFHLVSTVEGRLRPGIDALEALRSCFPGGSISGAPKKRACEIIRELEPCPRGIYTGAIGYFDFNGDAAFNIAIRTMIQERDELHFHVGGGITADSVPAREYEETLHKAAGMRLALDEYLRLPRKVIPS
jgi:para-aminobenzoate synthetase component I